MHHARLLDCTLRDGAYLVEKQFGNETIRGIIDGLVKAHVNFIEIGFFQNDGFGEGKTVFINSADAKRFIPADKRGCEFSVLADYSRYSMENLDSYDSESVDVIRWCFFKEERYKAIDTGRIIMGKGYKLFVQPVDILGYSDMELIELLQLVNEIEPYCFSIVDTFGSMYLEDLHRVFELIHHNLTPTCKIGFHSHNNMQMSNALSQEFLRMAFGKREVVVDGTVAGMGRGAGNTPTELIAQYMVSHLNYSYDIDALLDIIDDHIDNIRTRCTWGYSTPYFVAGCFNAHVNNVAYLTKKNSIRYKDIRYILNKIGAIPRKRYDYELLEKTYVEYLDSDIDDTQSIMALKSILQDRNVLIVVPGASIAKNSDMIKQSAKEKDAVVFSVNGLFSGIAADYVYMNNAKSYMRWKNTDPNAAQKLVVTSNIMQESNDCTQVVSFVRIFKCGWVHSDNSVLMLLRLLDLMCVQSIDLAGFDGYSYGKDNYASDNMAYANIDEDSSELNLEIQRMLDDYMRTRQSKCSITLLTPSRFHI